MKGSNCSKSGSSVPRGGKGGVGFVPQDQVVISQVQQENHQAMDVEFFRQKTIIKEVKNVKTNEAGRRVSYTVC
jgi:hypothetical protein